jgi:hypothetical protein
MHSMERVVPNALLKRLEVKPLHPDQ